MASTYEPIATTTLGSAAATITLSSIPSTYTDLRIVIFHTANSDTRDYLQFNSDTGTNYSRTILYGNGTSAATSRATSQSLMTVAPNSNTSTTFTTYDVFNYASTSVYKTVLGTASLDANGSGWTCVGVNLWRSTSAINSITINGNGTNYSTGTMVTIYGIKAA